MSAARKLDRSGQPPIDPTKIPTELRKLKQWVCWRLQNRQSNGKAKPTKVPFRASQPSEMASSTDAATWATFDDAMTAFQNPANGFDGIGFVFAEDGDLAGVDFDACLNEAGLPLEWVKPWLARVVGYAEVSPSGRGIKAFIRGEVPGGKGRKRQRLGPEKTGAIEIYDRGRFFTVTSRCLDVDHSCIKDGSGELASLYAELFPPSYREPRQPVPSARMVRSDAELIEKAQRSGNGSKFSALWSGSIAGHPSKSEADLALCSLLAWWTGGDIAAIDRLFRQSGLYDGEHGKWERITYREPTIDRACNQSSFYDPNYRKPQLYQPDGDQRTSEASEPTDDVLPTFGNHHLVEVVVGAQVKIKPQAHNLHRIDGDRERLVPGWPKRVGTAKRLFVETAKGLPRYLKSPPQLFAWFSTLAHVDWTKGSAFVTQEQYFYHLEESAPDFTSIETLPHVPPMPGAYYMHQPLPEPSGKLDQLVDRFLPATPADRSLILAMIATPLWGGLPGTRPAFLVTGPDNDQGQGRGIGKSTLLDLVADELYFGSIDVTSRDDMDQVKTRLLSSDGQGKRIGRLDNVKSHRFSWADLEGIISATRISGRALYVGEGSRVNDLTWLITLNGASLSKDMAERVITIQLDRPPQHRDAAWREDTIAFIQDHRWSIYADLAAILASQPGPLRPATRWAAWEKGVLSKLPLASECQAAIVERQDAADSGNADRDMVRDALMEIMASGHRDPATSVLRITSAKMAEIVSAAARKDYDTALATSFVKGLGIRELEHHRKTNARFWVWTGQDACPDHPAESFDPHVNKWR